jgi:hypothetical protein
MTDEIDECLKFVRDGWWTWFVTLKYPRIGSPRYTAHRYENPEEAFQVWLDEMTSEHGGGESLSYVRVIEPRENGDVLFHVLLRDVPEETQRHWRWRWYELTAGGAWNRRMNGPLDGLIRFFLLRLRLKVEYSIAGYTIECVVEQ